MANGVAEELLRLGVEKGDHVLVRVAGREMTKFPLERQDSPTDGLLAELLRAVGPKGTVLGLAFTPSQRLVRSRGQRGLFTNDSSPTTGKYVESMLKHPDAVRSEHPTNSFVAIGGMSKAIVSSHTPRSHAFRPVEDLVLLDGKLLLVGCTHVSPGFSTVHLAQFQLGLSNRTFIAGLALGKYRDVYGGTRSARKWDVPGCSMGFGRLYPHYRSRRLLREGAVWGAESMLVSAPDALAVEREILSQDPTAVLCSNPDCFSCRATLLYNRSDWLPYWRRLVASRLFGDGSQAKRALRGNTPVPGRSSRYQREPSNVDLRESVVEQM